MKRKKKRKKPNVGQNKKPSSGSIKVRKSNIFADGKYRFNLQEQKILLKIMNKVRLDEKDSDLYFVSFAELKEISSGRLSNVKEIDESCEKLKNKTIKMKHGSKEENFGILSGWLVEPGKGVTFRIDSSMKTMLLDLLEDGNFTLNDLECAMALSSSYSMRLYEIMKLQQLNKQPVILDLDKIKYSLDIDLKSPTYSDFGSFRVHILEKAQRSFKQHADIDFTYKTIKEGRKVKSLEITIKENKK